MRRSIECSTRIRAPLELIHSVLTSYEFYQYWAPDIVQSRVFEREGDVAVAEFIVPKFGGEKLLLEFIESKNSWISFHQVDQYRREGLSGRWDLEPTDGDDGVLVRASLQLSNGFWKIGTRRAIRSVLERTQTGLTVRCLRIAATGPMALGPARRKILDIVRKADSIDIDVDEEVLSFVQRREARRP